MSDWPDISVSAQVLARTAWGEARGEGEIGMQAVIATVMNRVALRRWYGITVAGVCLKKAQYSCWNPGDPNRDKLKAVTSDDAAFALALSLAERAIEEGLDDPTQGATHYYAAGTPVPEWALPREDGSAVFTVRIGRHLFFQGRAVSWLFSLLGGWLSGWMQLRRQRGIVAQEAAEHAENLRLKQQLEGALHAEAEKTTARDDVHRDAADRRVQSQYID